MLFDYTLINVFKHRVKNSMFDIALDSKQCKYNWLELDKITDLLAIRMLNLGITKNDHVGIYSKNDPLWIITFYAISKIGAIPVLINASLKEKELLNILVTYNINCLFYNNKYKNIDCIEIINKIKKLHHIKYQSIDKEINYIKNFNNIEIDIKDSELLSHLSKNINTNDTCVIMLTSGTTSESKGVVLSHFSILNNASAIVNSMKWDSTDNILLSVSLFHCFGLTVCLLTTLFSGSTLNIISHFSRKIVLETIEKCKITVLNGVPSMFLALISYNEFYKYNLDTLKTGIIAGSSYSKEEYLSIIKEFKNLNLIGSYGQTETSPCVTIIDINDSISNKANYAGKVISDVEIKIDINNEILVKGYNVMKEYYNSPLLTEKAFTSDGYLKTGDLGYLTSDGNLAINGRLKDIIIRGGENISPYEIEKEILTLDEVKNCKVLGKKAPIMQEKIVACISLNKKIEKEIIFNYLKDRLAYYKIPEEIYFYKELPRTESGKISIKQLKEDINDE